MLENDLKIIGENSDMFINIPISLNFNPEPNQYETLTNNYNGEGLGIINGTVDYEKIRIKPCVSESNLKEINYINFNMFFYLNNGWENSITKLEQIGYDNSDVLYRKEKLKKTFLRLSFYDSNDLKKQNLLYYSSIFIDSADLYSKSAIGINVDSLDIKFKTYNPLKQINKNSSEGYYLYLFKDDIALNENKTIYLKIEYNNAINGKTLLFCPNKSLSDNNGFTLQELKNNMFIEIEYKYDDVNDKYIYWFKNKNSENVEINLYQAKVK